MNVTRVSEPAVYKKGRIDRKGKSCLSGVLLISLKPQFDTAVKNPPFSMCVDFGERRTLMP